METGTLTLQQWTAARVARLLLLAFGPFLTLAAAAALLVDSSWDVPGMEFAVTLLWSPLFLSIPALLLQHQRDLALPRVRPWFWRGVRLIPHLATSKDSTIRPEMLMSLLSWMVLLIFTGASSVEVLRRLLIG